MGSDTSFGPRDDEGVGDVAFSSETTGTDEIAELGDPGKRWPEERGERWPALMSGSPIDPKPL